jgi:hypothetical protein
MKTQYIFILILITQSISTFGQQTCIPDENGIYTSVEENPKEQFDIADFSIVLMSILKIQQGFIKPDLATYHFTFIIDEEGNMVLFTINDKPLSYSQDDKFEIIKLLKPLHWQPGKCHGENVSTYITVPLKLQNN